ncbi:LysR family transcriptional regulator [Streptomyces luteosporeus]|uniref:LysR family transcriptional regulator n=1 Tax=Streptomyces luteosporeus TaxID=173856 RepID=A0ABP6G204_9ACTN
MQTPLLARTGRSVRLTEAGEILVRHATGILAGLAAAEEEVANIVGLRTGRVRLASFLSGTSELLPSALAALRAKWPNIDVSFTEAAPPRAVEMLRGGDCEIALAFHYPGISRGDGDDPWDGLVVRPLLSDRLVILAPAQHALAAERETELAALAAESWVAGCPSCSRHLVEMCEAEGFSPRIDLVTDDYLAVIALVGAGLGIATLPEMAFDASTETVRRLDLEPAVHREIVALTLPEYRSVPAVGAMLGELEVAARSFGKARAAC